LHLFFNITFNSVNYKFLPSKIPSLLNDQDEKRHWVKADKESFFADWDGFVVIAAIIRLLFTYEERTTCVSSQISMKLLPYKAHGRWTINPEYLDAMSYIGGVVVYFHIPQFRFIAKTKYFFTTLIFKISHFCFLQHVSRSSMHSLNFCGGQ
jgi:hypothetical protein